MRGRDIFYKNHPAEKKTSGMAFVKCFVKCFNKEKTAESANPLGEADLLLHFAQGLVGEILGFLGIVFDNAV